MGVMNAIKGRGRASRRRAESVEVVRDATLEDGLGHVLSTVENLIELDQRIGEIEGDLLGARQIKLDPIPSPDELGIDGLVPRLMESALVIGALTRRMHLRLGTLEGAMGKRAKPVDDVEIEGDDVYIAADDANDDTGEDPGVEIETSEETSEETRETVPSVAAE